MKLIWSVPLVVLTACASKPKLVLHPQEPAPIVNDSALRYPEATRPYYVGRYVDPNNSLTMHEQHVVYRVEQTSRWNLHPGPSTPAAMAFQVPETNPAFVPAPVNDAILAEVNAQKAATASIMVQTRPLSSALEHIPAALRQTKTNLQDTAMMRATLSTLERRLSQLESASSTGASTNNSASPFPSP
jgi:hypothetical protein